jgi:ribosomal protein L7Ae-like RNA K-turn-binding protein
MQNKIYSMIGLATKAGKVVSGSDACERLIKKDKALVVIVSIDASDNTKKMFNDMCTYRKVPIRYYGDKDSIGRFSGKETRTVLAINDKNFADRILQLIDGEKELTGGDVIGED